MLITKHFAAVIKLLNSHALEILQSKYRIKFLIGCVDIVPYSKGLIGRIYIILFF